MIYYLTSGIVALAALILLAGCAANRPYRTSVVPCDTTQPGANCAEAIIETAHDYKLGFVEFDDQGWFWNREQLRKVEEAIRTEAGIGQTNSHGVIMVLFAHGWKNNADFENLNVITFRAMLRELKKAEHIQSGIENRAERNVVGIYLGWRGLSAKVEPFKELSFWSRKSTAHKVGDGAMTEVLVNLEDLQRASNETIARGAPRTELIIIGHSFGGAAVYSAISQMVTERFVETVPGGRPLKPLGDQVILLNPAFEASRHYNLNELAVSISKYPESQRPVLSVFTSKGDWATHYAFPIGRFFSTIFQRFRSDKSQRSANWQAVGWFKPFITHTLAYDAKAKATETDHSTLNTQSNKQELPGHEKLQQSVGNVSVQRKKWHPNAATPAVYEFDDCILKPKESFRPGDPFLVVSVDKKIMSGHTDINNPVLINFLREFILFCQANPTQ